MAFSLVLRASFITTLPLYISYALKFRFLLHSLLLLGSIISFSASPVDYRLPWHLYILLSRCLRTRDFRDRGAPGTSSHGYADADESQIEGEGHSPSADLLASSYALELEQMHLPQEALFILLHLEGSAGCVSPVC